MTFIPHLKGARLEAGLNHEENLLQHLSFVSRESGGKTTLCVVLPFINLRKTTKSSKRAVLLHFFPERQPVCFI